MEKIVVIALITISVANTTDIKNSCIECHQTQKIPSELIYRRYLMTYSNKRVIEDKILKYLQNPKQDNSIMPKQFFLKFPMKSRLDLNDTVLKNEINRYIEMFDIKKRLILGKEQES